MAESASVMAGRAEAEAKAEAEAETAAAAAAAEEEFQTSEEGKQPTIRKKQRMNGQKTCRVCGDQALAHNFDVISCESCKAFFRRNALKTKVKPCAFKEDCEITCQTRRFCAHCRLKKCFESGMKADMILDVDGKKAREEKLAENRRKREQQAQQQQQQQQQQLQQQQQYQQQQQEQQLQYHQQPYHYEQQQHYDTQQHQQQQQQQSHELSTYQDAQASYNHVTSTGLLPSTSTSTSTPESDPGSCLMAPDSGEWMIPPPTTTIPINRSLRGSQARSEFLERAKRQGTLLDFTVLVHHDHHTPSSSSSSPPPPPFLPPSFSASKHQEIDESFQHIPHDQLSSDPLMYWRLTDEERAQLTDLTVAYQQTILKLPERRGGEEEEDSSDHKRPVNVEGVLNSCQRFATDVVSFVKKVPGFRGLGVQDQVAVLKGASWRTFLVKSSATFVVERKAWVKSYGYFSVQEFTEVSPEHKERIELLAKYSSSLKHIIRNDPTTFALLQVLVLFDPRDPNLSDRQQVSQVADKYALLLKHLLQSQWSYDYAGYYLKAVRDKLQELAWVADSIQVMFTDWVHLLGLS